MIIPGHYPADMDISYAARLIYRADKGELVGMISLASFILDNKLF